MKKFLTQEIETKDGIIALLAVAYVAVALIAVYSLTLI